MKEAKTMLYLAICNLKNKPTKRVFLLADDDESANERAKMMLLETVGEPLGVTVICAATASSHLRAMLWILGRVAEEATKAGIDPLAIQAELNCSQVLVPFMVQVIDQMMAEAVASERVALRHYIAGKAYWRETIGDSRGRSALNDVHEWLSSAHGAALDMLSVAIQTKKSMKFGEVLEELRAGKRAARRGWNGKGMSIALQSPDANSKMTEPYLYLTTADGKKLPWVCSQADILAVDWEIVD